jgi:photosystem II stability/assembly factor-like uncharacterized protein
LTSRIIACVLLFGFSAAAEAPRETPAEIFERGLASVQERYPGLITVEPLSDGIALTDIDVEKREVLYQRVSAGDWSEELGQVFRVVFAGMSMQAGTVAVEGRETLQVVSGLAAESGDLETILGVTALLTEMMNDAAHSYSILAQDLLSEKMRCGAASIGDDDLVDTIAASVDPDRAYQFAGTDGTIGDRYGLHSAADLFSVASRGEVVVAVGYFGSVLVSHDSGETFAAPDTGTDEPLFAVATGGEGEWWAAGRGGIVLYSSDDGHSWQRRDTPFQRHYFGVHGGGAAGDALIVGDFGLQLATRDAGKSWTCLPREQDVILGRIVPAGADAFVVGEFGTLERFSNNRPPGTQGLAEGVPDDFYVFDAWFDTQGENGVAVGLGGAVLRTEDRGATWKRRQTPFDADLYGVAGFGRHVLAVGEGGLIAISEDVGETFRVAAGEAPPVPLHGVAFDESGIAYLVGPRGSIFRFDVASESVTRIHPKASP